MTPPSRAAGQGALVAGAVLAMVGAAMLALSRTGPDEPPPPPPAPTPVAQDDLVAVARPLDRPHRISQRVALTGPVSAKQVVVLNADGVVRVECACRYTSTLSRPEPGELVEERTIEDAGVVVLALDVTDHALKGLVARLKDAGFLVPGDVLTRYAAGQASRLAAELLGQASDHLAKQWMEGHGKAELERVASDLGVAPDQALAAAEGLPRWIESMRGRRFTLRYRAGYPIEASAADGGAIAPEVQRWLEHSSVFLEADLARARTSRRFELPARALHDAMLAGFLPGAGASAVELEGRVEAELASAPVSRPRGEALREIALGGRIVARVSGDARGSSAALDLDRARSCALVGAESGALRELELAGSGAFASWALERLLGLPATVRLEGRIELNASQRCEAVADAR